MKIPFTVDQFFEVFGAYNNAIWPAQIFAYLLGILAVVLTVWPGPVRAKVVFGILSLYWAWMGIFYHLIYFSPINPIAIIFGLAFILQAILLAIFAIMAKNFQSRLSLGATPIIGLIMILYAMLIYPLLGSAGGHSYPQAPMFGVAPCPTTIFTFGLLLLAGYRIPLYLLIIPFLWALVGTSAAINLHVPQDYGLLISGVTTVILLRLQNRKVPLA